MEPTSSLTLVLLILVALASALGVAALWNRIGGAWWIRWPSRYLMLLTCQVTACLVLAAVVNDTYRFFTTWHELTGTTPAAGPKAPSAAKLQQQSSASTAQAAQEQRSTIVPLAVPDAGDLIPREAQVYLPAAYFDPAQPHRLFPVVELLDGFPGTPSTWTYNLSLQRVLDAEIQAGRATPFIAVMPVQNYQGRHDGECVNAVNGTPVQTTLTTQVRAAVLGQFRAQTAPDSWAVMGYSTGGFCALDLALRYPDLYRTAVSLAGTVSPYLDSTTGALFGNSVAARQADDPMWRVEHLPPPPVKVLLAVTRQDSRTEADAVRFARAARAPTKVQLLDLADGGHNPSAWTAMEPASFDWISEQFGATVNPPLPVQGQLPSDPTAAPSSATPQRPSPTRGPPAAPPSKTHPASPTAPGCPSSAATKAASPRPGPTPASTTPPSATCRNTSGRPGM